METNEATSWPYNQLSTDEVDDAGRRIKKQLKQHGRQDDADLFADLIVRACRVRTAKGDVVMLTYRRFIDAPHGFYQSWAADRIENVVDLLLSPDSDERQPMRRRYEMMERERIGVETMKIAEAAERQKRHAEEERRRRLEAWADRPRMERALLRVSHDKPGATPADIAIALASEPMTPTELPLGDVDLTPIPQQEAR